MTDKEKHTFKTIDLVHPELLSKETMLMLFKKRKIPCSSRESIDDLIKKYYETLLPLPQQNILRHNIPSKKVMTSNKRRIIFNNKDKSNGDDTKSESASVNTKLSSSESSEKASSMKRIKIDSLNTNETNQAKVESTKKECNKHKIVLTRKNCDVHNSFKQLSPEKKSLVASDLNSIISTSPNKPKHARIKFP